MRLYPTIPSHPHNRATLILYPRGLKNFREIIHPTGQAEKNVIHPCVGFRGAGEKFSRQPVMGLERAGDREAQGRRNLCALDW